MAETPRWQPLERDPDFEPLSRPRSCTWPLPRPDPADPPAGSGTSSPGPPIKQEPGVSDGESFALLEESAARSDLNDVRCPQGRLQPLHHRQVPPLQAAPGASSSAAAPRKSGSSRRNAWGSMSYADLITRAIDSSPEQRLTLAQIYDWMVRSVPYFKDKGDNNSSAGWKNSIRHNLSLHSRFVRMQNEGTGKSSWWMLNPEGGKNGKSPRRRAASMDNNSKFTKSRGRASKKKVTLQEGLDGATASPRSQYPKWVGSPNSHSNDDFETWSTFRTRASSDASTLSGRRSPFLSEQDDLGEADVHAGYPGGGGVKIAAPLPSLTELTGSVGQHGRQHVMESLLDNLNLISPKISQLTSDSSRSPNAAMLHNGPYSAGGVAPEPQQDDLKCLYGRQQMNSLPPVYMQAIPDAKQGFGPFQNHYNCPAGLLKELLTSDANPGREKSPSMEAVVSRGAIRGCAPPSYSSHDRVRRHEGVKMMNTLPQLHAPLMHRQGPSGSQDVNRCNMIPLTSLSLARGPPRMTSLRTCMQTPHGHSPHSAAPPASYGNGYRGPAPPHPHLPHQEGLPSDLDNVSIERFECDMESVLHDTLMDGDALDFNFDPTASAQMFPQRVKNSSHSWVSG